MKRYGLLMLSVALLAVTFVSMALQDPREAGPAGILGVFVLLYLFFLSFLSVAIYYGTKLLHRLAFFHNVQNIRPYKAYYLASIFSCLPLFMLAVSSIGELQFVDIVLIIIFVLLAAFYVNRRA